MSDTYVDDTKAPHAESTAGRQTLEMPIHGLTTDADSTPPRVITVNMAAAAPVIPQPPKRPRKRPSISRTLAVAASISTLVMGGAYAWQHISLADAAEPRAIAPVGSPTPLVPDQPSAALKQPAAAAVASNPRAVGTSSQRQPAATASTTPSQTDWTAGQGGTPSSNTSYTPAPANTTDWTGGQGETSRPATPSPWATIPWLFPGQGGTPATSTRPQPNTPTPSYTPPAPSVEPSAKPTIATRPRPIIKVPPNGTTHPSGAKPRPIISISRPKRRFNH